MNKLIIAALFVMQAACAGTAPETASETLSGPRAAADDLRILAGSGWKGHLSYLDYSSGALSKIPVEIQIEEPNGRSLRYAIRYPGETQYNSREKIKLSRDGRRLNGAEIVSRKRSDSGELVLVTSDQGKDDNRPARLRVTYAIGNTIFSISKEVRYEGESEYFLRNEYVLLR